MQFIGSNKDKEASACMAASLMLRALQSEDTLASLCRLEQLPLPLYGERADEHELIQATIVCPSGLQRNCKLRSVPGLLLIMNDLASLLLVMERENKTLMTGSRSN